MPALPATNDLGVGCVSGGCLAPRGAGPRKKPSNSSTRDTGQQWTLIEPAVSRYT